MTDIISPSPQSGHCSTIAKNLNLKGMDHPQVDFLQCLEADMGLCILSFIDDPADLVRASTVSRFWRQFVIANGLAKRLCLKKYPQLSKIVGIVDTTEGEIDSLEAESNSTNEWEILERDQTVYAVLLQTITKTTVCVMDCTARQITASSMDIQGDPGVPQTLIYKLIDGIWVISEIDVQPYEAVFYDGNPIYSPKSVRFRIGHPKSPIEFISDQLLLECAGDKFEWTYTSPEFVMEQEIGMQSFKLPEPVLCIGGYIQIELLGQVQGHEVDGLSYRCKRCVRARGRSVFPSFDIMMIEPDGKFLLKYYPETLSVVLKSPSSDPHLRIKLFQDLIDRIGHGPYNRFTWEKEKGDDCLVLW